MAQINETTRVFWTRSARVLHRRVLTISARMAYLSAMETVSTLKFARKKTSRVLIF